MNPNALLDNGRFLIVDDEREHVDFLIDYLVAKKINVDFASNAGEASAYIDKKKYLGYIIDLNIPRGDYVDERPLSDIQSNYVGLRVAQDVRTQGAPGRHVIAYSAHENDLIQAAVNSLYCEYIVKGRVMDLKKHIDYICSRS